MKEKSQSVYAEEEDEIVITQFRLGFLFLIIVDNFLPFVLIAIIFLEFVPSARIKRRERERKTERDEKQFTMGK